MDKLPKINAIISGIVPGSIAEELEIVPGDKLLKINDQIVEDQIAYKYLQANEYVELEIEKANGEIWILEIEKDIDEDLGLIFDDATFDGIKQCRNKCIFCFVDQMPRNLRNSLYVKDDDYRYSFLFGNFITLTNLSEAELQRIVDWKLSPLYVSVHTTNPQLRCQMLGNRHAGKIMEQLAYLVKNQIQIHAQIVLVPGVNDGRELEKTIEDLASLSPGIMSVAVVPVGLTSYRKGLTPLNTFKKSEAQKVLELINGYQKKFLQILGTRFVFAADEFFILGERKVPEASYYEGYPQLENGVGLVRMFMDDFAALKKNLPQQVNLFRKVAVVTGKSASKILSGLIDDLKKRYPGLQAELISLSNSFFGPTVTVAGLLTGHDLIKGLSSLGLAKDVSIIIPDVMLKDGNLFLDDLTLSQVEMNTGYKICPVNTTAKALVEALLNIKMPGGEV